MGHQLQQVNQGNILVIDDSIENLQLLSTALSQRGYTVRGVTTGSTAVMLAKLAPPDLILLDILMPEISGYEVCQQLKAEPATRDIPVIFLSVIHDVLDKVKAFQMGGVDYITKPFQTEEVLVRVENQLTVQRLSRQLQEQNQRLQQEIEERRNAEKLAADAAQAKNEFIANMSHQLRTPLNAILGFAQIMSSDPDLNADQQENISIIQRSGEHLLELINDVLELSKIEAGITTLEETSFDLYQMLDSLEEVFQIKAAQKKNLLSFIIESDVPQYIKGDQPKLRCCLINLIENAIKFTTKGFVTLRVSLAKADLLCFEVEDTGCGIAANEINQLFDAFVQTTTGKTLGEGTGLGLTITQKFVQMMKGKMIVQSTPNRGSSFKFQIKLTVANASEVKISPLYRVIGLQSNQPKYKILVVDDTEYNTKFLVKLLSLAGFEVHQAENGKEAIAIWESWQPHLIWMDIRMPVIDGMEATRQIRSQERKTNRKGHKTIVLALVTYTFLSKLEEIWAAGFDDFVVKPLTTEVILEKMAEYLNVSYIDEKISPSLKAATKYDFTGTLVDAILLDELSTMPLPWLKQLYYAANEVNEDLIEKLVQEIPAKKVHLSTILQNLINHFRFDLLIKLTQKFTNT